MFACERLAWVADVVDPAPGERILEVECGQGLLLALLAERLTTGIVVGIDRSTAMIAAAQRRNRAAVRVGRVRLQAAPLAEARLGGQLFDVVVAADVPSFWTPPTPEWEAVDQLLVPRGRVVVVHQLVDGEAELVTEAVQELAGARGLELVAVHRGRTTPTASVALELRGPAGRTGPRAVSAVAEW